jgi:hypothetical protein
MFAYGRFFKNTKQAQSLSFRNRGLKTKLQSLPEKSPASSLYKFGLLKR